MTTPVRSSSPRPIIALALLSVFALGALAPPSVALGASVSETVPVAGSAAASAAVVELRTEGLVTPLGIDATPARLSWQVTSPQRGATQAAHRVRVASDPSVLASGEADVWDSGRVPGAALGATLPPELLEPATRYHWHVEVELADDAGRATSEPSWFETGIGDDGWADAAWIAGPETGEVSHSLDDASWIWHPDGIAPDAPEGRRYLRTEFEVRDDVDLVGADLVVTADDWYSASVDGETVGISSDDPEAWRDAEAHSLELSPGPHAVAIEVLNRDFAHGGPSPAGLLAVVELRYDDGEVDRHATDASWQSATEPSDGWDLPGFDGDDFVEAAVHAPYGDGPWGDNVRVVTAPEPAPLFRHDFTLDAPVADARLYVTAGGYVTSTLNGEPTSDDVLSPGPSDYRDRVAYATHDVGHLLVEGDNTVAAEVGRGFFSVPTSNSWGWDEAPWRDDPQLRALLVVDHPDGTTTRIGSGSDWTTVAGPRLADSIYEGDVYDARLAPQGHDRPGFDADDWVAVRSVDGPDGALEGRRVQPVRVVETLQAEEVTNPDDGVYLFRFPRQVAGWPRLHVTGPEGAEVRLRSSERVTEDGRLDLSTGFTGGDFQTDRYTLSGDPDGETWEPSFSYKGFQYVEVTGWPGGAPQVGDVEARVVHNDLDRTGRFSSDVPLFDQIHGATVNTVLNNFHDVPTDTPKYEKNGWTGDAALGAELFLRNLDAVPLLDKWLDDVSDARWPDGRPALIAPNPDWSWADESPTWHAAYVLLPWQIYEHTGDPTLLERHYEGIVTYVDLELEQSDDGIASTELGDYLPPDAIGNPPEDMRISATAYLHEMAETAAAMAEVLGEDEDAARLRAAADDVATALHERFFDPELGAYVGDGDDGFRQTHQVLPLAFGIVPDEHVDEVVAALVHDIEVVRDGHLWTGVLGTKFLLPVLTDHGHGELAYRVATQTDFPSWGRWFEEDGTSLWEHWSDYRSRNHYFLGTIDDWFAEDLAGVRRTSPGYETFEVIPQLLGDLGRAEIAIGTPRGEVASGWQYDGEVLDLAVTVPVGATAQVHVPIAETADEVVEGRVPAASAEGVATVGDVGGRPVFEVEAGTYRFRVGVEPDDPDEPEWPRPPFDRGVERVCVSPPPAPFVDVPSESVHAATIACLAEFGLTIGSSDPSRFLPRSPVTRAQMASFLVRWIEHASGSSLPEGPDAFGDDDGSPHEAAIDKLAAVGVTEGLRRGGFGPGEPVTRAQMASFIDRTLDLLDDGVLNRSAPPGTEYDVFPDDEGSVHAGAIDRLAAAGIVQGWSDGTFRPGRAVQRDQMASFVMRAYDAAVELGYVER